MCFTVARIIRDCVELKNNFVASCGTIIENGEMREHCSRLVCAIYKRRKKKIYANRWPRSVTLFLLNTWGEREREV